MTEPLLLRPRRSKLVKQHDHDGVVNTSVVVVAATTTRKKLRPSKALQKHGGGGGGDGSSSSSSSSGGIQALLPSFIGLLILAYGVMAKMGFRGRATVAGIDLGTTNSVICVQAPAKGVGVIECIPDPITTSPIVPSVVSFLDASHRPKGPKSKTDKFLLSLNPHPSAVVVGVPAKKRIDSHPHSTLYNAKRVLGRPLFDTAIAQLQDEVEFKIVPENDHDDDDDKNNNNNHEEKGVVFEVPYETQVYGSSRSSSRSSSSSRQADSVTTTLSIPPHQVGSYIVYHLLQMTQQYLGHNNVKQAVICVPAKFNARQRQETIHAFAQAGVTVLRTLEEPTAAALAYGLHRKDGVDYILVYDFGGGTLDVSLLQVSQGGYVDVLGSDGDDRLGGADFDAAVAHYWLDHHHHQQQQQQEQQEQHPLDGHGVIDRVSQALQQILHLLHHNDDDHDDHDNDPFSTTTLSPLRMMELEQRLEKSCPALAETPLCTASSFHTIAEQLKIQLSSLSQEQEGESHQVQGTCLGLGTERTDLGGKDNNDHSNKVIDDGDRALVQFCQSLQPIPLHLSLSDYNDIVQPLLHRSRLPVQRLLTDLDIIHEEIDEVVLVGGTSRMPQIRTLVQQLLPTATLNTHIDPDLTVAYGAASVID